MWKYDSQEEAMVGGNGGTSVDGDTLGAMTAMAEQGGGGYGREGLGCWHLPCNSPCSPSQTLSVPLPL